MIIRAILQARMSSKRFPGKVLAPLHGQPIIRHVISRVAEVIPLDHIIVATSNEASDDPLACYLKETHVSVYRGPLDNVFRRFQLCINEFPCSWFFRVCGDSPFLQSELLTTMMKYSNDTCIDLVTNIQIRTFPVGQSVEMINAKKFSAIEPDRLSAYEKEHVTKVFYNNPKDFKIMNIESTEPEPTGKGLAVDTLEDLYRLERNHSRKRDGYRGGDDFLMAPIVMRNIP